MRWIDWIRSWLRPRAALPSGEAGEGSLANPQRLASFQQASGLSFRNPDLLRQALTHRSSLGSNGGDARDSNERMEFLGDAVLELLVVRHLYRRFPDDREGELTKKKGLLVCRDVLARRALQMGLGEWVYMSDAERDSGGATRANILADAFEAVIGALFLDGGLEKAADFVQSHLLDHADAIVLDPKNKNHKSQLQEMVQARYRTHPKYRVVSEVGPDHCKLFTVEVLVKQMLLGRGQGYNKKEAEQNAAANALLGLGPLPPLGGLWSGRIGTAGDG